MALLRARRYTRFLPLLLLALGGLVTSHLAANRPHRFADLLVFYCRLLCLELG